MQYILLIYGNEAAQNEAMQTMSKDDQAAEMGKWFTYTEDLKKSGVYVAGEALHPTATASTVKVADGERMVTDGPFAETKEQLGGYFLADCKDLDQAIELAQHVPVAATGSVEIRPLVES